MSAPHWHNERLSEVLLREIGIVIAQKVRDPRIPPVVTVTEVKLAQDNRNATVFVSLMGEESEKKEAIAALNKAAPFIQRTVARKVVTKHFPHLYFKLDDSIERSQHLNELLKEIHDDLERTE
ncbi:MAG: 30S ribosome-binding factor RbfA [Chitinispirillaceae bacterium]